MALEPRNCGNGRDTGVFAAGIFFFTNFRETDLTYSNSNVYIGGMGAES